MHAHMPSFWRSCSPVLGVMSLLALAPGCGGLTALETDGGGGGGSVPPAVREAFAESCAGAGCHDGATRAGGLSLADADLDGIVGAPSSGTVPMVTLGDVHQSYLAIKMLPDNVLSENGLMRTGGRMPITGDFQNPNNATILAWVAGAEFPGDTGTSGSTTDTGGTTDGMVTFGADIWPLLMAKCSCHSNGGTPNDAANGALVFTMADAYDALVGAPSVDVPSMNQVEPGDPSESYLWHKVAGTQASVGGAGMQMPLGVPLSADDQALIEDWIIAGAPQ